MSQDFQQVVAILSQSERKFVKLVEDAKTSITFKTEMLYASTAMMNNEYLAGVAVKNPMSLRSAFQQVAACGLTLNPARVLAYLVPRDGQVLLDISYRGMIRMAVEDGAIKDCIVELVYSTDEFSYKGKRNSPEHVFNPFADKAKRGEFIGVYVEAMLPDGRLHVEAIPAEEIYAARAVSDLWKRKKKGPWVDFFSAMAKKAAIKIARKYWPQGSGRLDNAIAYLNENGEGFAANEVPIQVVERYMGEAEVVEPVSDVIDTVVQSAQADAEKAELVAAESLVSAEQAQPEQRAAAEAPAMNSKKPADPVSRSTDTDAGAGLPTKVRKKTADLVSRAQAQGCWEAALEYIQSWPVQAKEYAQTQLQAAQYAAVAGGE